MPTNYYGDNGKDIVNQNANNGYYNIYTYGGNDEISLRLNKTLVEAGSGNDYVKSTIEYNNDIYLGAGNDTYVGMGFTGNLNRYDIVSGGTGSDTFEVWTRASEYYGDSGSDTFKSAGYLNAFFGGSGTDTVSYQLQDKDSYLSGTGVLVNLQAEFATTGGSREELLVGIENAVGTSYGDDILGDDGSNKLWGMDGRDMVDGRGGDDMLYGGKGNDDIYGGSGNDDVIGGAGYDFLWGNKGADTFHFESVTDSVVGKNRDVIKDFSRPAGDMIDLSAIDAIQGGGDDDFDFIGSSAFSGMAGELRFRDGILSGDVDGDGSADFQVRIDNVASMKVGDFIL